MNQSISFSDSLMASLSSAMSLLFAAVPRVLGFLVILAVGWIVAALIDRGVVAILRAVHFDSVAERAGLGGMARSVKRDASGVMGTIAKWFVRLIALVVAFDALGVPAVSQVLHQLVLWVPNLAVALLVLVLGGMAANALADLVRGAAARGRIERPDLVALVARGAVWGFAILVALYQIGVAGALLDIVLMSIVGAVALAAGLAFGLGGRDTAGRIVRDLYERNHGAAGVVGRRVGAANEPPYNGIEHRHALADRRANPNGRRAVS